VSHLALAANGPAPKVSICHVNSANDVLEDEDGVVWTFGRVIEVSENAVEAHVAQHGDGTSYEEFDKSFRDTLEARYGISLPNANCRFSGGPE
jgi:hypothetical protein